MENEVVDTASTEVADTNVNTEAQQSTEADAIQAAEPEFKPFATGKEKFKVNGVEEEWDWDTTKRFAQIGKAGFKALEKAAATEKKAQATLKQLQDAASRDPEGLIQILTGNANWKAQVQQAAKAEHAANPGGASVDEIAQRIRQEIDAEYGPIKQKLEAMEIEKERAAIESELSESVQKFPELNTPIHRDLVKQYYARAIKNGLDVGIDDVAFHVSQELKQYAQAQQKKVVEKIEDNKRRAPVTTRQGGKEVEGSMSIEDVKRLAGRI